MDANQRIARISAHLNPPNLDQVLEYSISNDSLLIRLVVGDRDRIIRLFFKKNWSDLIRFVFFFFKDWFRVGSWRGGLPGERRVSRIQSGDTGSSGRDRAASGDVNEDESVGVASSSLRRC